MKIHTMKKTITITAFVMLPIIAVALSIIAKILTISHWITLGLSLNETPLSVPFIGLLGSTVGILIWYMINYLLVGFEMFFFFFYMALIIAIFIYVSRTGKILGAIILPLVGYTVFVFYPGVQYNLFFWIIIAYIFSFCIYHIIKDKKLRIEDETFKSHWWRVIIRPVALLFLVFYIYYSKEMALIVIGIVGLCFIALDIIRFLHRQANVLLTERIKKIFRKDEKCDQHL